MRGAGAEPELLVSASADKTVRICDPATGATERILEDNIGWVKGFARRCG